MPYTLAPRVLSYGISDPVWLDPAYPKARYRQRICHVAGLLTDHCYHDQYGQGEGMSTIDASIAHIIVALNAAGHHTLFCCSGLPEDHKDYPECDGMATQHRGYILFADDNAPPRHVAPEGVKVSWNATHWKFSWNHDLARAQWRELAAKLGTTFNP